MKTIKVKIKYLWFISSICYMDISQFSMENLPANMVWTSGYHSGSQTSWGDYGNQLRGGRTQGISAQLPSQKFEIKIEDASTTFWLLHCRDSLGSDQEFPRTILSWIFCGCGLQLRVGILFALPERRGCINSFPKYVKPGLWNAWNWEDLQKKKKTLDILPVLIRIYKLNDFEWGKQTK